jgi:hypothetical protein
MTSAIGAKPQDTAEGRRQTLVGRLGAVGKVTAESECGLAVPTVDLSLCEAQGLEHLGLGRRITRGGLLCRSSLKAVPGTVRGWCPIAKVGYLDAEIVRIGCGQARRPITPPPYPRTAGCRFAEHQLSNSTPRRRLGLD